MDLIWTELERQFGTVFVPEERERLSPGSVTTLFRCNACGLEYFHPAEPADGGFYEHLARTGAYYESHRWEFERAASRVLSRARVLEVGAGNGAFLSRVAHRCERMVALDANDGALEALKAIGAEVWPSADNALDVADEFDVMCAFNVVEHVAWPAATLQAMARRVAPAGRLLISVPNRDRWYRSAPLEPLDCPPHHMTRWSAAQADQLERTTGLHIEAVEVEPAPRSQVEAFVQEKLATEGHLPAQMSRAVRRGLVTRLTLPGLTRSLRLQRRGLVGHSMLFVLSASGSRS
jgi:SAM-dependent methyltransferase